MSKSMRLAEITNLEELRSLVPAWRELYEAVPGADLFLGPDWLMPWCETFGADEGLRILAVSAGERLAGLLPLKWSSRRFRVLTFAGLPQSDRLDLLALPDREAEVLETVAQWLASRKDWDMIFLRAFGVFSRNPESLAGLLGRAGLKAELKPDSVYPYLDMADTEFMDYMHGHFNKKRRIEFFRFRRKVVKDFPDMAFETSGEMRENDLEEMRDLNLHRSERGRQEESFFLGNGNMDFLRRICAQSANNGRLIRFSYRDGTRLCAYLFCWVHNRTLMPYLTSFDQQYSRYTLGTLTVIGALEQLRELGLRELDFLEGNEAYKFRFTTTVRESRRMVCFNRTLRGRVLNLLMRMQPAMKRLAGKGGLFAPLAWARNLYRRMVS